MAHRLLVKPHCVLVITSPDEERRKQKRQRQMRCPKRRPLRQSVAADVDPGRLGTHRFQHTYRSWLDAVKTAVTEQERFTQRSDRELRSTSMGTQ